MQNPLLAAMALHSAKMYSSPPSPPGSVVPEDENVLASVSPYYLNIAFSVLKPQEKYVMDFSVWQEVYHLNPSAFKITYPLHQKSGEDVLHLSVSYTNRRGWTHYFHINGFWLSKFQITSITMQDKRDPSTGTYTYRTIAEF